MSELSSIARPYAQAVFELARESDRFEHWSSNLSQLSELVEHPDLAIVIRDPRIARNMVLNLILEVASDNLDEQSKNLVRILIHYRRLPSLPLIAQQFESLRAEHEGIVEAQIEIAYELDQQQQDSLIDAMQRQLGRKVRLTSCVNTDLIGGAVIRAGDWVIDGSIKARLQKLASSLGV